MRAKISNLPQLITPSEKPFINYLRVSKLFEPGLKVLIFGLKVDADTLESATAHNCTSRICPRMKTSICFLKRDPHDIWNGSRDEPFGFRPQAINVGPHVAVFRMLNLFLKSHECVIACNTFNDRDAIRKSIGVSVKRNAFSMQFRVNTSFAVRAVD